MVTFHTSSNQWDHRLHSLISVHWDGLSWEFYSSCWSAPSISSPNSVISLYQTLFKLQKFRLHSLSKRDCRKMIWSSVASVQWKHHQRKKIPRINPKIKIKNNWLTMKNLLIWMQTHWIFTLWATKIPLSTTRTKSLTLKVFMETMKTKHFHSGRECIRCKVIEKLWTVSLKWHVKAYQNNKQRRLLIKRKTCWQWFHSCFTKPKNPIWDLFLKNICKHRIILSGRRLNSSRLNRSRKSFALSILTMPGPSTTTIGNS